ncbi:hypothetical protein [Minwuia thermotolerans]|uniref:Uncharacterized protein n=1 Tax=Minwuia thermotolerans TaxID=2056226 RepID=A0A2M9FV87_9PROT|nr:hypothetical protein [Minwuia thermotolerans]PJK27391.1 hypothetical protein CVT23_22500 [Minwuia thermotolerans]
MGAHQSSPPGIECGLDGVERRIIGWGYIDRSKIGRVLQPAYLAPDIAEAILDGRQPSELTAHWLKRMAGLPLDWAEQRKALGFA